MVGRSIAALGILENAHKLTFLSPHGERIVKPLADSLGQVEF